MSLDFFALWKLIKYTTIILMSTYEGLEGYFYNWLLLLLSWRHPVFLLVIIITYSALLLIWVGTDDILCEHLSIYFFANMYVRTIDLPLIFIDGHAKFQRIQSMQGRQKSSKRYITWLYYLIVLILFILLLCTNTFWAMYDEDTFRESYWTFGVGRYESESTRPFVDQLANGDVLGAYNTFKTKMPHLHLRLMVIALNNLLFKIAVKLGSSNKNS